MRDRKHITVGDVLDGPDPFFAKAEKASIDSSV